MGSLAELETPLFASAHSALVFAFNFSGQSYDRPMMNRMADGPKRSGKGLVGLDGAGQAGFIRAEVSALGKLAEAVIVARIAPRSIECPCGSSCCSGHKPNVEWSNAIAYLSDHMRRTALFGCTSNGLLRREYVARYFCRKESRDRLEKLAERYGVDRHTISAHAAKVAAMLGGSPAKKDAPAVLGIEDAAMGAIDDRLHAIGMVGA